MYAYLTAVAGTTVRIYNSWYNQFITADWLTMHTVSRKGNQLQNFMLYTVCTTPKKKMVSW